MDEKNVDLSMNCKYFDIKKAKKAISDDNCIVCDEGWMIDIFTGWGCPGDECEDYEKRES